MESRLTLIEIAQKYVGVKEQGGDNKGPEVERFQKAVDGKASGEPWCMAFVQYCIKESKLESKIFESEHCLTVWNKTPKEQRLKEPKVGSLVIWQFGDTSNGHVGIVTAVFKNSIHTIEGNTGDGKGVVREGDGIYARNRSRAGSQQMKILGYLKIN